MQPSKALPAAAALALLSTSAPALAQPAAAPQVAPAWAPSAELTAPAPRTEHYGWQILLTDAAVVGATLATAAADDSGDLSGTIFVGGYLTGAPVVHLAHDNPRGAVYSLGLRLTAPVAGAILGIAMDDCREDEWLCPLGGMALGGAAGMLGASIIDATLVARKEVPAEDAHLLRLGSVAADPVVSAAGDRAFVGLAGSF